MGTGFTEPEAKNLVGRRVRLAGDLPGVPKGASGTVARVDPASDGFAVGIEWDVPGIPMFVDWFDRDEFTRYLVEE